MDEKSRQLGMPFGTANARLRKQILFALTVKHKENLCYRCHKWINHISEFTIEHKSPWLHISTELFWDLENIAFSHLYCNVSSARKPWGKRANAPKDMHWCSKCQDYQPTSNFHKNKSTKNGLHTYCITHHIEEVDSSRRRRGLRPSLKGDKHD